MNEKTVKRRIKYKRAVAQGLRDGTTAPDYGSLIVALANKALCSRDGGTLNATGIRDYVERKYNVPHGRLPTVQWLTQVIQEVVVAILHYTHRMGRQARVMVESIGSEQYFHIMPFNGVFPALVA